MEINTTNSTISVHGREALSAPYTRWTSDTIPVKVDISASTMFIEVPGANLRAPLLANPTDIKGLLISLTREQVETLPIIPSPYIILDETVVGVPQVELEGKIYRTGYIGEPSVPTTPPPVVDVTIVPLTKGTIQTAIGYPVPHIIRQYIEDLPGLVTGVVGTQQFAKNTQIINATLAFPNTVLYMRTGTVIYSGQITPAAGCAIICEKGGTKPLFYMPAFAFKNTVPDTSSILASANLFNIRNVDGVTLEGFGIQCDLTQGHFIVAINANNCKDTKLRGLEIFNLPTGVGISASSIGGDSHFDENHIHDFYDNTTAWTSLVQGAGILIDGSITNGATRDLTISRNRIEAIRKGPDFAKLSTQGGGADGVHPLGQQNDGIGVQGGAARASFVQIHDNRIDGIDEAIDYQGIYGNLTGNILSNSSSYGLKLTNGAAYNVIDSTTIVNSDLACLGIAGTSVAPTGTIGNTITNTLCSGAGYLGSAGWGIGGKGAVTAAVHIIASTIATGVFQATDNTVSGITMILDGNSQRGWQSDPVVGATVAGNNVGDGVKTLGSPSDNTIYVPSNNGGFFSSAVRLTGTTNFINGIIP